jgi:hypothetical protein
MPANEALRRDGCLSYRRKIARGVHGSRIWGVTRGANAPGGVAGFALFLRNDDRGEEVEVRCSDPLWAVSLGAGDCVLVPLTGTDEIHAFATYDTVLDISLIRAT